MPHPKVKPPTSSTPLPLVIVPCGGAKLNRPAQAGEMYVGQYHRACRAYALVLTGGNATWVLILSAKYGLLRLDDLVEPYDLRMGRLGCVTRSEVWEQAAVMKLLDHERVVALGGREYVDVCRSVWPHCETPLAGTGGIGKQLAWMKARTSLSDLLTQE